MGRNPKNPNNTVDNFLFSIRVSEIIVLLLTFFLNPETMFYPGSLITDKMQVIRLYVRCSVAKTILNVAFKIQYDCEICVKQVFNKNRPFFMDFLWFREILYFRWIEHTQYGSYFFSKSTIQKKYK